MDFALPDELHEIRAAVRELCARFPGEYWRALEPDRYPEEFVAALTEDGWLAALIPEEYGGAGLALTAASVILEEINASGGNAGACHAQMYIMGTILRHGSRGAEGALPAADRLRRAPPAGVRRDRARRRAPTRRAIQTTAERADGGYVVTRPEDLDLAGRALRPDAPARADDAADEVEKKTEGLSSFLVDMKRALADGTMTIRPIKTMMNHATTEIFLDGVEVPADDLVGEEGQGLPLHPRRHERRAHPDRGGVHRRRPLVRREGGALRLGAGRLRPADRREPGRPVPDRAGPRADRGRRPMRYKAAWLFEQGLPCGAEANMAKLLASEASWAAANACLDTHGGFGFAEEYDVERKFRETRLYKVAPVSNNLILAYVGQHVLGMPRSY